MKRGLVVGSPLSSMIVPGASGLPWLCATRVLPCAMRLVAKSSRNGGFPGRGMPMHTGFVPKRGSRPPQGATIGREMTFTKCRLTSPAPTHCSAQWPIRPR